MNSVDNVIELHPPAPRHYAYRSYPQQPPAHHPFARLEWRIEQQLADAWEAGIDPRLILTSFTTRLAASALPALDVLFETADQVRQSEMGAPGSRPLVDALDEHGDALHVLARILNGQGS